MKKSLVALFALAICACGVPAKTVEADTVSSVEAAWLLAATACTAQGDPAVETKCADVLLPARAALIAAASDVDSGGKNYVCELSQVGQALTAVGALVKLPPAVKDAVTLLSGLPCADAGFVAQGQANIAAVRGLDGGAQ